MAGGGPPVPFLISLANFERLAGEVGEFSQKLSAKCGLY